MSKKIKAKYEPKPRFDSGGNLHFSSILLTKESTPNRARARLKWRKEEDIQLDNYRKNPAILYIHESDQIPIGYGEPEFRDNALYMNCIIPDLSRDKNSEDFDKQFLSPVRGAIHNNLLNAMSAGFYINEAEITEDGILDIFALELVEASVCPIPAHESAIIKRQDISQLDIPDSLSTDVSKNPNDHTKEEFIQFSAPMDRLETGGTIESEVGTTVYDTDSKHNFLVLIDGKAKLKHDHSIDSLKETLAKLFGSRGGVNLEREVLAECFKHIATEYKEAVGTHAPPLMDYKDTELEEMHSEGYIIIPGRQDSVEETDPELESNPDIQLDEDSFNRLLEKMEQKSRQHFENLVIESIEKELENRKNRLQ